jgi:hypothetical protein
MNIQNILFTWEDPNSLILPVGSDNRITIPSINAENYSLVPVDVIASSGISPGVYPLAILIEYYDQTGEKQTINSTVGLQISGKTTFDIVLQTSTSSSTTFAVVNTGANKASSVVVSIPQQQQYSTSGTSQTSLGNLDAGDYTLASFSLSSTSSNLTQNRTMQFPSFNRTDMNRMPTDGNFTGGRRNQFFNQTSFTTAGTQLIVQITYTDVFGVRQTVRKQVNLSGSSTSGFSSQSTSQGASRSFSGGFSSQSQSSDLGNSILYIAIGIVGIVAIVAVIQLGRKKKLSGLLKSKKGREE